MQTWRDTSLEPEVDAEHQPTSIHSSCGGDCAYSDAEWKKENPMGTEPGSLQPMEVRLRRQNLPEASVV